MSRSRENYREDGVAYWCSREGGCCAVSRCMGRGRGQEGNECTVRETLGIMVLPMHSYTWCSREGGCSSAGRCMGRGQEGNECPEVGKTTGRMV